MRKIVFLLMSATLLLAGCMKDSVTEHYTFFRPVYQTKESVRTNVRNDIAHSVSTPGKLVWKDDYIFLNDVDKGVHIIDISNATQPKVVSFISIPGCVDLAVYGNYLYADCYTDLVTIDISDPLHVVAKQFLPGVFPYRVYNGFKADTSRIIMDWVRVDTQVTRRFSDKLSFPDRWDSMVFNLASSYSGSSQTSMAGVGLAGSTMRFALMNQRMYTVSYSDLKLFNLTAAASPSYVRSLALANGNIETIFPYNDKLFIGSQTGMFIYDASNPDQPSKLGQFTHARSCDPVITDGSRAYVTLRGSGLCGGNANQLDVLDVNNLLNPQLIKSYPLHSPSGLSKDNQLLLICDGDAGLKIFDAANPSSITLLKQVQGFAANDVVARNGLAVVTAKDGLHLIDYTSPATATEISRIAIASTR
jgi:hypothetical protein